MSTPAKQVWQARTGTAPDPGFLELSQSVDDDEQLIPWDIAGSIAHTIGLHHAQLVTTQEATALIDGLQQVWDAYQADQLTLDPGLEDVHMNVEHQLGELVGDVAGKLHTGRSRNDQVALDLVLATRKELIELAQATLQLADVLATQAGEHTTTPWVAETHGQSAQPATLGFLLHAHALRSLDLTDRLVDAFHRIGESPLGAGACAGSTLPLSPEVPARVLSLAPPRNALLATGQRDHTLIAGQLAAHLGTAVASLAQQWLELTQAGHLQLPAAFTTGSSLMPHKRNPDALELVRGHGRALTQLTGPTAAALAGLPLGYHRDLQTLKAPMLRALSTATSITEVLTDVIQATSVDVASLEASLQAPGITATDAVEALVTHGVAFRRAYTLVAQAAAATDDGTTLEQALADVLADAELSDGAIQAALAALTPDPARRTTLGGPAPSQVQAALDQLAPEIAQTREILSILHEQATAPLDLLTTPAKQLTAEHAPAGGA